jgi:adenylosuccinate synthase
MELASLVADLARPDRVERLVEGYRAVLAQVARVDDGRALARRLDAGGVVMEGAQGALLDADRGFWPHVTPSCTLYTNALALLAEAGVRGGERLGVLRAYGTRHGAGPFVAEEPALGPRLPERHNAANPWQGPMRVGWLDLVLARYAVAAAGGVDALAVTCLDRLAGLGPVRVATAWRWVGDDDAALDRDFVVERAAGEVIVRDLRLPASPARAHQAELALRLASCRPILVELEGWAEARDPRRPERLAPAAAAFVRFVEERLGAPARVVATGPTAGDRLWRD